MIILSESPNRIALLW